MRICKGLAGAMLLVAMLVGANVTKADTFGYVWLDYLPGSSSLTNVTINTNTGAMSGNTGTVGLGEFAFDVTGFTAGGGDAVTLLEQGIETQVFYDTGDEVPLYGYCIDTGQWLDEGDNRYEIKTLKDIFMMSGASDRSDDVRKLYYDVDPSTFTTAAAKLQFGVALWEIMYEDSGTYSVTGGDFALADTGWTIAQGYLTNLGDTINRDVFALYDPVNQDFSVVVEGGGGVIPEPFTMATAFLAIGSFGMYIRKHTRKRT